MHILKLPTRGSICAAKFFAGSLSSSRDGNFKIFKLKIAVLGDIWNGLYLASQK